MSLAEWLVQMRCEVKASFLLGTILVPGWANQEVKDTKRKAGQNTIATIEPAIVIVYVFSVTESKLYVTTVPSNPFCVVRSCYIWHGSFSYVCNQIVMRQELAEQRAGGVAASASGAASASEARLWHVERTLQQMVSVITSVHHGCLLRPAGDKETEPSGGRRLQYFGWFGKRDVVTLTQRKTRSTVQALPPLVPHLPGEGCLILSEFRSSSASSATSFFASSAASSASFSSTMSASTSTATSALPTLRQARRQFPSSWGPQPGTFPAQFAPLDPNLGPSELSAPRWTSTAR